MKSKKILTFSILLALSSSNAIANDRIKISGFGQVAGGTTLGTDDAHPEIPYENYSNNVSFREESLLGLQLDANLSEDFTATAQLLAKGQNDYEAELSLAYVQWDLTENTSLKFGRQRASFFKHSNFLDVGYAHPWVRLPAAVYSASLSSISNIDGVGLLYHRCLSENWHSSTQIVYGSFDGDARFSGSDYRTEVKDIAGLSLNVTYNDWFSSRASYFQGDVSVFGTALDQPAALLQANGLNWLSSQLTYDGDKGTLKGLGVEIDKNNWVASAEYTQVKLANSAASDKESFYVSLGHRFGKFTPFVVYGQSKGTVNHLDLDTLPLDSRFRAVVSNVLENDRVDDRHYSVGVRHDFRDNVAFKAEYSRIENRLKGSRESDTLAAAVVFKF